MYRVETTESIPGQTSDVGSNRPVGGLLTNTVRKMVLKDSQHLKDGCCILTYTNSQCVVQHQKRVLVEIRHHLLDVDILVHELEQIEDEMKLTVSKVKRQELQQAKKELLPELCDIVIAYIQCVSKFMTHFRKSAITLSILKA